MIQIIDTYKAVKTLLAADSFNRERWEEYMRKISPDLLKMVLEDASIYDFDSQIQPVLEYLFAHRELAEKAHGSFLKVTEGLEEKCLHLPGGGVDSTVLFYLGLCSGAGWAASLNGKPAILLGLEKIVELHWVDETSMTGLIDHELGHNWHFQNRGAETFPETPKGAALWQLYTEGVAMWFEQAMYGDRHFYHQNKNGWLAWCEANRFKIARNFEKRAENGCVQDFFGDWCSFEGRSDTGYYLGAEIAHMACEERGVEFLLHMTLEDVEAYLSRI